jgi:F1F0 ATPase subunit 2
MMAIIPATFVLLAGVTVGMMFFGGLLWTVKKVSSSKHPGLLFAGSLLLRIGLALIAFFFIGGGNWQRLVVCLIGFVLGRMLIKRFSRIPLNTDCRLLKAGVR